jgi:hypothetical protein
VTDLLAAFFETSELIMCSLLIVWLFLN